MLIFVVQEKIDWFVLDTPYNWVFFARYNTHLTQAWGVDRLMMILEKKASIREVMAFPKTCFRSTHF